METQGNRTSVFQRLADSKWGILVSPLYLTIIPLALLAFYLIALLTGLLLLLAALWVLAALIGMLPYCLLTVLGVGRQKRLRLFLIVAVVVFVVLAAIQLVSLHENGGILNSLLKKINESGMGLEGP